MNRGGYLLVVAVLLMVSCASTPPVATAPGSKQAAPAAIPQTTPQTAPQAATEAEQRNDTPAQASPPQAAATDSPLETTEPAQAPPRSSLLSSEALGIYRTPEEQQEQPTRDELAVIASAKTLIGKPPNAQVMVNGKGFTLDCIGTVSAIYYGLSLDVTKDFGIYTGNGVNRLYMTLKERNALHTDRYPRPGDVIIWDNTWDVQGNGDRVHSPRTHAGIVLAVDEDGTILSVHENLYKGVKIETMNLLRPTVARDDQGKRINSGMAIASKPGGPAPEHSLAGDVFNCFGDVLGLKEYFFVDLALQDGDVGGVQAEVALKTDR
jgi:cell wall-associated NlpC family hydrolase